MKRNTAIKTFPPIIHPLKMAEQYTQGIQGSKEQGIAVTNLAREPHFFLCSKQNHINQVLLRYLWKTKILSNTLRTLANSKKAVMFVAKNIQNTQTHIFCFIALLTSVDPCLEDLGQPSFTPFLACRSKHVECQRKCS